MLLLCAKWYWGHILLTSLISSYVTLDYCANENIKVIAGYTVVVCVCLCLYMCVWWSANTGACFFNNPIILNASHEGSIWVCVYMHQLWSHTHIYAHTYNEQYAVTHGSVSYCFNGKLCAQTHTHTSFPLFIQVITVLSNQDPTIPIPTLTGGVCLCDPMCVCLCLCVRVPRVLVKYSKIDLTPKAFSRSQMGRE